MTLLPAMNASIASRHGRAPTNSTNLYDGDGSMCVCSRMRVRTCVRMRDVFAIFDNNI